MTAALAALEYEGRTSCAGSPISSRPSCRRTGSIARGTPALIAQQEGGRFRLYVPQELGHFVAEVVADLERGLGR